MSRVLVLVGTLAVCFAPIASSGQERATRLTLDDALRLAVWRLAATSTADPALLVQAAALARHAHNYEQAIVLLEALPEADRGFDSYLIHGDSLTQLGRWKPADAMLANAQSRAVMLSLT